MRSSDYGSGFPKPETANDTPLYHNDCGGKLTSDGDYYRKTCKGCGKKWTNYYMGRLKIEDLHRLFHLRPPAALSGQTLVWKSEGRERFAGLVPTSEAHKYEKVKV